MTNYRSKRPYEQKTISKSGLLIFSLGLGALLITATIIVGLMIPNFSDRFDSLAYRARTYYRHFIPHPDYLPTPALEAAHTPPESRHDADGPNPVPLSPTAAVTPAPALIESNEIEGDTDSVPSFVPETNISETNESPGSGATERETQPTVSLTPTGDRVQLTGLTHQWQTWNNCGPATITTYMSYFGYEETQADAALFLKPNQDDKNVGPHELAAYAQKNGLGAMLRQGGSLDQLKQFLSNDIPVLVETWLVHDGDGLGHYRLVTGFDDTTEQFTTADSLNGPAYNVSYEQLDTDWRVFNRLYIVVYPPERAETVAAIVGVALDDRLMYEQLLATAEADIEANAEDAIAHFNRGEALTRLERYEEAVAAFDQARRLGLHWRRLWYQFTPFEAYYAVGRYQDVLELTQATIRGAGGLEEAYYYHGLALQASGQVGAAEDFEAALSYNPNFTPAAEALRALETETTQN